MRKYLPALLCLAGFFCLVSGWMAQPMTSSAHIREKYRDADKWPEANAERRSAELLADMLTFGGLTFLIVGVGTSLLKKLHQSKAASKADSSSSSQSPQ
jgi:hypothetical protein